MIDLTGVKLESELLEPGEYVVVAEDAEIKSTKSGDGEYINVRFKVAEGPRAGKVVYQMFNIKNPNAKAVTIGMQQLKSFMLAAGFDSFVIKNVTDLCGAKAIAKVKTKIDEYGEKNVIAGFKEYKASAAAIAAAKDIPF
jgi:hypothetical protein